MNSIEQAIGRWLERWVGAVQRNAVWVTVGMLLATLAIIYYVVGHLGIRGDTESLFSQDLPFKQHRTPLSRGVSDALRKYVRGGGCAPRPSEQGKRRRRWLRDWKRSLGVFTAPIFRAAASSFENHAFLYLETQELEDLADKLAIAQPYLAELSRDGTLRGLVSMMARGGRAVREGDVSGDQLHALFDRFLEAISARIEGRPYHLSWAEVLAEGDFDLDSRRRFLLVQPVLEFDELQPAKRSILAVRRIVSELGFTPESGVSVRITGDVALILRRNGGAANPGGGGGIASLVLVAIVLILGLRSVRMVLATLATLIVGLVWTAGFTAAAIGHLNMISVCFAVLFIGLGVDFGIHVCIRYRELLVSGLEHSVALQETARDVGAAPFFSVR